MTVVVHVVSADAIVGHAVVDDVLALDATARPHVVIVGAGALDDDHRARLGSRVLAVPGPSPRLGWRDVTALDDVRRAVRDQSLRHGRVVVHAHGSRARSFASVLASGTVSVVVDDGDDTDAHRFLPLPDRTVFASHGDLDRALERGFAARYASLVPPGLDQADAREPLDHVVIADDLVHAHLAKALATAGFRMTSSMSVESTCSARLVVCGRSTRLNPGVVAAVISGVRCVGVGAVWADDVAACAAFMARETIDLDELVPLAQQSKRLRPRRAPRALGRDARTRALVELYDSVSGPDDVLTPRLMRRRPRR